MSNPVEQAEGAVKKFIALNFPGTPMSHWAMGALKDAGRKLKAGNEAAAWKTLDLGRRDRPVGTFGAPAKALIVAQSRPFGSGRSIRPPVECSNTCMG